jgi:histidinol-phosphate aminotransferase
MKLRPSPGTLIRANIQTLEPYHCAREQVQTGLLLDANENPFPRWDQNVQLNRYPDPYQRGLRKALADRLGVTPDMVLAGNGSDEVLDWLFKVFELSRGVAIAEPTYGMYRVLAGIYGVPVIESRLDAHFAFSAQGFMATVPDDVRMLILCSPNNPTGNLLDAEEILKVVAEWDGMVVVDEAYIEFSGADSLAPQTSRYENLAVLRTFSKAFGRAGVRLGYIVAAPWLVSCLVKVKAPYNLNAWVLTEGVNAVKSEPETSREVRLIVCERERMRSRLSNLPGISEVFPSDANFILFRCDDAAGICAELLRRQIVVRDRSSVPGLEGCIRLTVGTPEENAVVLRELANILGKGSKPDETTQGEDPSQDE